jgi:hypothetical protein
MMFVARSNASGPFDGVGWELDAIAAVFIGGAAVTGGVGTVVGSIVGGLVMAVLNNGLQLLGIGADRDPGHQGPGAAHRRRVRRLQQEQGKPSITGLLMRKTQGLGLRRAHRHPQPGRGCGDRHVAVRDHPHRGLSPFGPPARHARAGTRGTAQEREKESMRALTKVLAVTAVAGLALTGCGRSDSGSTGDSTSGSGSGSAGASGFAADSVIGISLPQKTSENWVLAEKLFNDGLTSAGFKGDVQFANGGVSEQQNQIQAMVTKGAKVIVVGAIDGGSSAPSSRPPRSPARRSSPTTASSPTRRTSTTTSPTTTSRSVSSRARPSSTA